VIAKTRCVVGRGFRYELHPDLLELGLHFLAQLIIVIALGSYHRPTNWADLAL
jgi:hypothetical protein